MNPADSVELLKVEARFQTAGGLVLRPDFDVPPKGKWKNFTADVVVVAPNGRAETYQASFSLSHFRIPEPSVEVNRRWRVVVSLISAVKEAVPVGSKVLVSESIKKAILQGDNA